MKRVTYISRFATHLSKDEINAIAEISEKNNKMDGLTGVLFTYKDVFYQIIEGEEGPLDLRLKKIFADDRHKDLFVLKVEKDVKYRAYSDWAMKTVILDDTEDFLLRPVSEMLGSVAETWMILKKYTPERILTAIQLGENPLQKKAVPIEKVILFGDLYASTSFGEKFESSLVFDMLEAFFNITNETIREHNGCISKLIGDGLMAVFNTSETRAALEAVIKISGQLKKFRDSQKPNSPFSLIYGGFGLSAGKVLEGNVGSISKKDFTYLGDTVNTAARLQGVTRKIGRSLVFDESLLNYTDIPNLQKIGRYFPRGKDKEVNLYSVKTEQVVHDLSYDELKEKISFIKTSHF